MDDNTLAAQYAQTGDLMDLCNSEAWLHASAQLEDESEGRVEAGLAMREYSEAVNTLTEPQSSDLRQQVKVQSILFTALRQWMESWNLGAGFNDTYAIARRLLRNHLADLTPTQQTAIEGLPLETIAVGKVSQAINPQVFSVLLEMFTQEDWQTMAAAASQSISLRVLDVQRMQPEATVV